MLSLFLGSAGLPEQMGATDLLGTKRRLVLALGGLVGAVSAVGLAGLLAGAALMVQSFRFVERVNMLGDIFIRTCSSIEFYTNFIVFQELARDTVNESFALWFCGLAAVSAASTVRLWGAGLSLGVQSHGREKLLILGIFEERVNPRPVIPFKAGVLPGKEEPLVDGQHALQVKVVVHDDQLTDIGQLVGHLSVHRLCFDHNFRQHAIHQF